MAYACWLNKVRMQSPALAAAKWYDLQRWPIWLRWCIAAPLSVLPVAVVYVVYGAVDRFAPGVVSGIAGVLAAGISSAAFVYCGSTIAPRFRRYVRYTLATAVVTTAIYYVAMASLAGFGMPPVWYAVLTGLAAAAGVVWASAATRGNSTETSAEVYGWMPDILRWLAFIPVAFLSSLFAGYGLGLPLLLLRFHSELVPLVTTPVVTATFAGAAVAVAPRHKKTVALIFGALTALLVILLLWGGLVRAVNEQTLSVYAYQKPNERALLMTVWYEILTAAGSLAGLVIAIMAVFRRRD
ncbi:MAG TPA: hypothetical protein VFE35_01465 [Candidatus Cybelea sp.]|jgi:hypothetical protein|nr:hypothetical protein [Candidatus Cybelea sp.]